MAGQRYQAVLEVLDGTPVTEVAQRFGVARQTVHRWVARYRESGLDGLADRSHAPQAHPWRVSAEIEAVICDLRTAHRSGGPRRLAFELERRGHPGVARATGRAVCLAFTTAMAEYGLPAEVLTDNGKQFTGRFGRPRPAAVLFERICRENGITQRLTRPRSPATTGRIERLHQALQLELLNVRAPFADIEDAQAAVDAWRKDYNTRRPHQALNMAYPAARFAPAGDAIGLRVPAELTRQGPPSVAAPAPGPAGRPARPGQDACSDRQGRAVEPGWLVPPSGSLWIAGQQIWLGPALTGRTVRFWAGLTQVHVLLDGHRIKTLPSRLGARDLARLTAAGHSQPGRRRCLLHPGT